MNLLNIFIRRCRASHKLIAAVLFCICSQVVWAGASCSGGGQVVTISMPTSIAVPRDRPAGTALTGWFSTAATTNYYACSASNSTSTGMGFQPTSLTKTGKTYVSGGVTYSLFDTGVAGVGVAIAVRSFANGCSWQAWLDLGTPGTQSGAGSPPPAGWMGTSCNADGSITNGGQAQAILVSTGPVSPGATKTGTLFWGQSFDYSSGVRISPNTNPVSYVLTSTAVTVLACTTPDVSVPLGTHWTNELKGVGTTTSAVSFNISVNNCPAGMSSVQYRIDPTTSVLNKASSVVALDSDSTATGMGVQLLNSSGTVFPLSTNTKFSGYVGGTGGSYTIPMQARYYQTGAAVGAGTANTSMTLTMTYQ